MPVIKKVIVSSVSTALVVKILLLPMFTVFLYFLFLQSASAFGNTEYEREDLRSEYSKTYQTGYNTFRTEVFSDKQFYKNTNKFVSIRNEFVKVSDPDYAYKNTGNDFDFYIGKNISNGVKYVYKNSVCTFALASVVDVNSKQSQIPAESAPQIHENTVTYPDIYEDIDLEFVLKSTGIVTNVVMKSEKSLKTTVDFTLNNCPQRLFSVPTMSDKSNDAVVEHVITMKSDVHKNIRMPQQLDQKTETLTLNPQYEKLETLEYPIRVDPSIINGVIQDTFVSPSTVNPANGGRRFMPIGTYTDYTLPGDPIFTSSHALLNFGQLSLPSNAIVQNAKLQLWHYGTNANNQAFYVSKVTAPWNENTVWPGPSSSGDYGSMILPQYNSNTVAQLRELGVNNSLITELRNPNNGIMLRNYNDAATGGVICSKEIPSGPCLSGMGPKIVIDYFLNQAPYVPNLFTPTQLQVFRGNCNESTSPATGNCRSAYPVTVTAGGVGDPDMAPGNYQSSIFYFSGANNLASSQNTDTGSISYANNFVDGVTNWSVVSKDNMGLQSQSATSQFIVDTTPPTVPVIHPLSVYSKGTGINNEIQIEIQADKSTDSVFPQTSLAYDLQYSTDPLFQTNTFAKSWQTDNPIFQIGALGADNTADTADDLHNDTRYYFRIRAKDTMASDVGNISAWSEIISTTIDTTLPQITEFTVSDVRFSPNNATSLGIKDHTIFTLSFTELHPHLEQAHVYSNMNTSQIVRTLSPVSRLCDEISHVCNVTFDWNGKDDQGNDLVDGNYSALGTVYDLAANKVLTVPLTVILDNSEANITISSPIDNFWTNHQNTVLTGQVTVPRDPAKKDEDINKLEINKLNESIWNNVQYDDLFFFSQNILLQEGQNVFNIRSTDTVGNTNTVNRTVYLDTTAPQILSVKPDNLTNNTKPTINFSVDDKNNIIDNTQISGIEIGKNPSDTFVSLAYDVNLFNITTRVVKPLIAAGVNLDSTLISDLNCISTANSVIKNGKQSATTADCSLQFIVELQPDRQYYILVGVKDIAGNETKSDQTSFVLDSHIYGELSSPVDGGIYANSRIVLKGKGSKNSQLTIKNSSLNREKTVTLNETLNNTGDDSLNPNGLIMSNFTVSCNEFIDIDNLKDTPDEAICSWEVYGREKYSLENKDTINNWQIIYQDDAQNKKEINRSVISNLYKIDLNIHANLNYFSPNGDGNQDAVIFTHTAQNPTDPNAIVELKKYDVRIIDKNNQVVKIFSENNILPYNTFWDGKDNEGRIVVDGEYRYQLSIETADGVMLQTNPQSIFVKTVLKNEVIITSPYSGFVTTEGVITIQGQAPPSTGFPSIYTGELRGDVVVDICVNAVATNLSCDLMFTTPVNAQGFFSSLAVLPNPTTDLSRYTITAVARDEYGNSTPTSNSVDVLYDIVDPFQEISITPALTGVNTEADIQKFLNGEISINQLRTVLLHAKVTNNTELLQHAFAEYNDLHEKPIAPYYNFLSTIDNITENSTQLNPFNVDSIKHNYGIPLAQFIPSGSYKCEIIQGCVWDSYLPIKSQWSGIYEVEFMAKKGQKIQSMTAGLKVDAAIPAAPYIMAVEKHTVNNNFISILPIDNKYYVNDQYIRLRGAAEPDMFLELYSGNVKVGDAFKSSSTGVWEVQVPNLLTVPNFHCTQYQNTSCVLGNLDLFVKAYRLDSNGNRVYEVNSTNTVHIEYDVLPPVINSLVRSTPESTIPGWIKSYDTVNYVMKVNESLSHADLIREDQFTTPMQWSDNQWNGNMNIDRKDEGYYYPQIVLQDLAGNLSMYDAHNQNVVSKVNGIENTYPQPIILPDWKLYVDNTRPDIPSLNKDFWGIDSGFKADKKYPELGRLNPQYVLGSTYIDLFGYGEQNQRIELFINDVKVALFPITNQQCKKSGENNVSANGLITKYNTNCLWQYRYHFPDDGYNTATGVPIYAYTIKLRTIDAAYNMSDFTPTEIIYHDTQSPVIPTINVKINGLMANIDTIGEALSDMQYDVKFKNIVSTILQNSSSGKISKSLSLGKYSDESNPNCIKIINGRRVGVCEDGMYEISARSADAAGNISTFHKINVERDTVAPMITSLSEVYICGTDLCIDIVGENGSALWVNNQWQQVLFGQKQTIRIHRNWLLGNAYQFKFRLQDQSHNYSPEMIKSFIVPGAVLGNSVENNNFQDSIYFDVNLKYDSNEYFYSDAQLVSPLLQNAILDQNNSVSVLGINIPKNYTISGKIYVYYKNYIEAVRDCKNSSQQYAECIAQSLGFDINSSWFQKLLSHCDALPIFSYYDCLSNSFQNNNEKKYIAPIDSYKKNDKANLVKDSVNLDFLASAMLTDNGSLSSKFSLNSFLRVGDKVKSKNIFYPEVLLSDSVLSSTKFKKSTVRFDEGLHSEWSSAIEIPTNSIQDADIPTGFPFKDFHVLGDGYAKYFGKEAAHEICNQIGCTNDANIPAITITRGGNELGHTSNAIDFADQHYKTTRPTPVYSTLSGNVEIQNKDAATTMPPKFMNGKYICSNQARALTVVVTAVQSGYKTSYLHLHPNTISENIVNKKQLLSGDQIGFIGNTGCSTGPHLHYEIAKNNNKVTANQLYSLISNPYKPKK